MTKWAVYFNEFGRRVMAIVDMDVAQADIDANGEGNVLGIIYTHGMELRHIESEYPELCDLADSIAAIEDRGERRSRWSEVENMAAMIAQKMTRALRH